MSIDNLFDGIPVTYNDGFDIFTATRIPVATWNGWLTPEFTEAQARTIPDLIARECVIGNFDSCNLLTVTFFEYTEESGEVVRYFPNPHGLYAIGAGSWTWQKLTYADEGVTA